MTTQQIAERLVALCRKGDFETAQKELFSDSAVSIEPYETPEFSKETKGLDAILEKGRKFQSMTEEMHVLTVSEPLVAGNSFAMVMGMDMKMKGQERMSSSELCVYQVKDGKVISESFHI